MSSDPDNFRIVVEDDLSKFSTIWPRSDSKTSARRYVFQCADLLKVWCNTIGNAQGVRPIFVAVFDSQNEPLILLPVGIRLRYGVRQLVPLDGTVCDYNAPVVFAGARDWDADTVLSVWRNIVARLPTFDVAIFEKMPELVEDWPNPMRLLGTGRSTAKSHIMTLPKDWERGGKELLPNWRDSRRRKRKLAERGALRVASADNLEEALSFLDAMISMKRKKLRDITGADPFAVKAGYSDYFIEVTRQLYQTGAVHLSAIQLDGTFLSAHWGLLLGERFHQLMPAFREDDEWRFYAPGRLLNEHLIEWSARQGLSHFDFGVGDEPYKMNYCDTHWTLLDAVLPITTAGWSWALARSMRRSAVDALRNTSAGGVVQSLRKHARSLLSS